MALSEEENVFACFHFDDGFLVEDCQDAEMMRFLLDFDDLISEKGCEDVVSLLPKDPFGMNFNMGMHTCDPTLMDFSLCLPRDPFGMDFDIEATLAAINGWMEDLGLKDYGFQPCEADGDCSDGCSNLKVDQDNKIDDYKLFAELNFTWATSLEDEFVDVSPVMNMEDGSYDDCTVFEGDMDDVMCFGCEKYGNEHKDESVAVDTIIFVLQHVNLGVTDLLSIERVCKSLRKAVQKDPYLWTSIHIGVPLSSKITDEDLLRLTDRAQGKLHCLSLMKCLKIGKDGLKQVLERNLELTKLSVEGSSNLSGEGLLHNLKFFNSVALHGIKRLRIGTSLGLTSEHLKELKLLLGEDGDAKSGNYTPRFYRKWEIYLSLENERAIDIEICPRCQNIGQVFDCPSKSCQAKIHSTKPCRGCISCIGRCVRCGCCLDGKYYEETFCFDLLCFDCLGKIIFQGGVTVPHGQCYFYPIQMLHYFLYS